MSDIQYLIDEAAPEVQERIIELEAALHAALVDLDQCASKTEMVTGELMTWKDSRRIANRAAIAARKVLESSE